MVWVDFNNDGAVDFGEQGVDGVAVTLSGTDDLGNHVSLSASTANGGVYSFDHVRPGSYSIAESSTPPGYVQGRTSLGTLGGLAVVQDVFSQVRLGVNQNGLNYNFGEQPAPGAALAKGQSAGIGFWNNRNGQKLINSFGSQLGKWLAATLPNTFGSGAGANSLAGLTAAQVASAFQLRFVLQDKLDAQVMATALNIYATSTSLGGAYATAYGFAVDAYGLGDSTWYVGSAGAALGVANNSTCTVMQLLQEYDGKWVSGVWNGNSSAYRNMARDVFASINAKGGI
jgi:hypothetical protein